MTLHRLIIILLLFLGTQAMADKYKNPYFGINLDLAQVGVDIRLNDIPVYYDDQKGQLSVDLPAPEAVINGTNELKIIAFTPFLDQSNKQKMDKFLPGSEVTATLYVQETDDDSKKILTSISIQIDQHHKVEVIKSTDGESDAMASIISSSEDLAVVTRSVNIDSPFPRWAWQDGQTIENSDENYSGLLQAYRDVYEALASGDITRMYDLYSERASEIAIAYHLDDASEGHRKINTGEDARNPELELYKFWDKNMILDIYANGKLARIIGSTAPTIQPIVYLDRGAGILHKHKFGFYKNKEGKWIMIR